MLKNSTRLNSFSSANYDHDQEKFRIELQTGYMVPDIYTEPNYFDSIILLRREYKSTVFIGKEGKSRFSNWRFPTSVYGSSLVGHLNGTCGSWY